MKKHFKVFWLAFFGVVWLVMMASSCRKPTPEPDPDPDLPAITQEGKGTIGCYINGKPWVPKPYLAIGTDPFLKAAFDSSYKDKFYLQAIKKTKDRGLESLMSLSCYNLIIGTNVIETVKPGSGWAVYGDYSFKNGCINFNLDTTKVRQLVITKFDKTNNIISGTFEFTVYNDCKDTMKITKGRFDTQF
jgi:hypothetical protein